MQFKSSDDAQVATELDGEDAGGELKLLVKLSDPTHKQERHGALYEGTVHRSSNHVQKVLC